MLFHSSILIPYRLPLVEWQLTGTVSAKQANEMCKNVKGDREDNEDVSDQDEDADKHHKLHHLHRLVVELRDVFGVFNLSFMGRFRMVV